MQALTVLCVSACFHMRPVCYVSSTATMLRPCCLQTRVEERGEVIKRKMATPDYAGKTPVRIKEQVSLCGSQPLQRVLTAGMQCSFSCPGLPPPNNHASQQLSTVATLRPLKSSQQGCTYYRCTVAVLKVLSGLCQVQRCTAC